MPSTLPRQFLQDLAAYVAEADAWPAPRPVLAATVAAVTLSAPPLPRGGARDAERAVARVLRLVTESGPSGSHARGAALRAVAAAAGGAPAGLVASWVARSPAAAAAAAAAAPALASLSPVELVLADAALARADALLRSAGVGALSVGEVLAAARERGLDAAPGGGGGGGGGGEEGRDVEATRRALARWVDMTVRRQQQ